MPTLKLTSASQLVITRFWRVLFLLMLLLLHVVALRGAEDFWARGLTDLSKASLTLEEIKEMIPAW